MTSNPSWRAEDAAPVWRPYCKMKTAAPPLAVARTEVARLILEDGRELVDGIASWWTACRGYNHPHIRAAVQRQLEIAPHMMTMQTNGQTVPEITGPPPPRNGVVAGIFNTGCAAKMPTANTAITPIFMYELR